MLEPRTVTKVAVVIEVIATVLVGAYVRFSMSDPRLGLMVWIVGGFASFSTAALLLKIHVEIASEISRELAEVKGDIGILKSTLLSMQNVLGILDTYIRIQDPLFSHFKNQDLRALEHKFQCYLDGEAHIEGEAYYQWLETTINAEVATLWAISMRPEHVYSENVQEKNWLAANVRAAQTD